MSLNGTGNGVLASHPQGNLHRIMEVRVKAGMELESVAADLGKSPATAKIEEDPKTDLRLSVLREWSRALGVSIGDLLIERPEYAGIPGLTRQRLKQIEGTAEKLISMTTDKATLTFAVGLHHQIREFFEEDQEPLGDPGAVLP